MAIAGTFLQFQPQGLGFGRISYSTRGRLDENYLSYGKVIILFRIQENSEFGCVTAKGLKKSFCGSIAFLLSINTSLAASNEVVPDYTNVD